MFLKASPNDRETFVDPVAQVVIEDRETYYGLLEYTTSFLVDQIRYYFRDNPRTRNYRWAAKTLAGNREETDIENTKIHIAAEWPDNPRKVTSVLVSVGAGRMRDLWLNQVEDTLLVLNRSYDPDNPEAVTAARTAAHALYPIVFAGGETLQLKIDGGGTQTITFLAGSTSESAAILRINATLVGAVADDDDGQIRITSDATDLGASVEVVGGTARAALGMVVGVTIGAPQPEYFEVGQRLGGKAELTLSVTCRAYTLPELDKVTDLLIHGLVGQIRRVCYQNALNLQPDSTSFGNYQTEQLTEAQKVFSRTVSLGLQTEWYDDFYWQAVTISDVFLGSITRDGPLVVSS